MSSLFNTKNQNFLFSISFLNMPDYTAAEFIKFTERHPNSTDLNPLRYHVSNKLEPSQSLVLLREGTEDVWPIVSQDTNILFSDHCKGRVQNLMQGNWDSNQR
jgi:hypothetical protein